MKVHKKDDNSDFTIEYTKKFQREMLDLLEFFGDKLFFEISSYIDALKIKGPSFGILLDNRGEIDFTDVYKIIADNAKWRMLYKFENGKIILLTVKPRAYVYKEDPNE